MSNEPAFPQERVLPDGSHEECEGLSVRDYFAAKAMQGLLASDTFAPVSEFVRRAYEIADAMMEERINHE